MSSTQMNILLSMGIGAACMAIFVNNKADGYAPTTISTGTNPVFAIGGSTAPGATSTLNTAPSDQKMIIADVVLTIYGNSSYGHPCNTQVTIVSGAGTLAEYRITSDTYYNDYYMQPTKVSHSYRSGLPVDSDDTFGITNHGSACTIAYSLSGYYAQP